MIARFKEQPRLNMALAAACIALIVLAFVAVGPASQSSGQGTRTATVQRGVVQSTVSGTGNIQAASQLNLGFKTSGTVTHIYVTKGQHVTKGQLLATVDPQSAEVTLEQAKASLQSAEANVAKAEEGGGGETSSAQGTSGSSTSPTAAASAASVIYVANSPAPTATQTAPGTTPTTPTQTSTAKSPAPAPAAGAPSKSTTPGSTTSGSTTSGSAPSGGSAAGGGGTSSGGSSTPAQSAATLEANLASARATVKSDQLVVQSDEKAVRNTKLYAPEDGTIVALSGEVGETVSGTGTTKAAGSSSSSAGTSAASSAGASSAGASSSTSGSTGSSSPAFAVLSHLESMQLVVPLSESEIGSVRAGQVATVTVEALSARKVAAHVLSIDQLPTSSSGVVSYDVAFQLDQGASGVKTGMSATAEVVVKQEEGLNVPSSAVSRGSVTVVRGGKHVSQQVTTGLVGNSSTVILSGLQDGEEVVLPTATSTSASSATRARTGALGGGLGGGGGIAGGGLGGGGFAGGGGPPTGKGGG